MNRNRSIFIISAFCITTLWACTKHQGDIEEQVPTATLTFASPTNGAVYQHGDSVLIQGLAIATEVMHGYKVSIKNAADTSVVYYAEHIHDHNDTLQINQAWKNTLTTAATLQVEVVLTLDHEGHTSRKAVNFKTQN